MRDGKPHLLDRRHTAQGFVHRVVRPGKGQSVQGIKLLLRQGERRGILHKHPVTVTLQNALAIDLVLLVVLELARLGVGFLAVTHLLEGGTLRCAIGRLLRRRQIAGATHLGDILHRDTLVQQICDLDHAVLAHAEHQKIRTALG